MRKVITLFLAGSTLGVFAQNNLHDGKIIGTVNIGNKQISSVLDEITGCSHKSSLHTKNLFVAGENVKIDIKDGNDSEIIKPNLPEVVYIDKCNSGNPQNDKSPYSADNYMDRYGIIVREAIIETNKLNKEYNINNQNLTKEELWKNNYLYLIKEKLNSNSIPSISDYYLGNHGRIIFDVYSDKIKISNYNAIISISKAYENSVLKSQLLTNDEKTILLALISQIKHLKTTLIEENGIWANGEQPFDSGNPLEFHPWDDRFNNCMKGRVGRGPFSNMAWVLSGDILLDAGDCIGVASDWW